MLSPKALSRRLFIGGVGAVAACAATPLAASRMPDRLSLLNLHTEEKLDVVFRGPEGYDRRALAALNHMLRDWRRDEVLPIDPKLFDIMASLAARLGQPPRYSIISGYRSPQTNAMLRRKGAGAAKRSLHMQGRAIDLRLKGTKLSVLRRAALDLAAGGVGYYPRSDFVHVDTGDVRSWNG